MRRCLAVVFLAFAGCGGGMDDMPYRHGGTHFIAGPDSRLTGNWIFIGDAAGLALDFDGANTLRPHRHDGQRHGQRAGRDRPYSTSGGVLTLTPQQASCAGVHPAYTERYSFSGANLVVRTTAARSCSPNPPSGGSVALTYGCFDSAGTFTASPLVAVSNERGTLRSPSGSRASIGRLRGERYLPPARPAQGT